MNKNLTRLLSVCLAFLMFVSSCNVLASAKDLSEVLSDFYVAKEDDNVTEKTEQADERQKKETEEVTEAPAEEDAAVTKEVECSSTAQMDCSAPLYDSTKAASVTVSGAGTESSPYLIYTEEDLIALALGQLDNAYKAYYMLKNDIELTADTWTPIGPTDGNPFQGVFDGDGHTISSTILFQSTGMSGVFGVNKGTIKNLNVYVTIADVATDTGALVATNNGIVENCHSTGAINATTGCKIGGLVGYNTGKITQSSSSVTVTASGSIVGGLVGYNDNGGVVEYSYATGDVTGNNVGGLIGEQHAYYNTTKTMYSYALGKVTGNNCAGGLIGSTWNDYGGDTYIEYCYAKGVVASGSSTGGLAGASDGTKIRYSYYNKTNNGNKFGFGISISNLKKQSEFYGWNFENIWAISSDANDGYPYINLNGTEEIVISGIGSQLDPYIIRNEEQLFYVSARKLANAMSAYYVLANDITVTANFWTPIGRYSEFTGNFDGNGHTIYGICIKNTDFDCCGLFEKNKGTIKNLTVSDVNIEGNNYTGAIAAINYGTISNCFVKESAVSNVSRNYVGGMVGWNEGKIYESGVECDVVSSGAVVGGLAGVNYNGGVIKYCYASGDVTGRVAGGLVGEQKAYYNTARINDSYSMGKVTGSEGAGGLVGSTWNDYGGSTYIEYCYARGLVASQGYNGGLIGSSDGTIIRYCYYNHANTGNKIGFSTGASTLKNPDTLYGWDFDNIWTIETGVNSGYPIVKLRGETPVIELQGSGDEDDPYLIHNEEELWALVLDKGDYELSIKNHYKLANDIVVTAKHWTPIGENGANAFAGTFDGDGHTISGIKLSNNYYDYIGLFGYNTGTIKNLNVEATLEGVNYAGCLVAYNAGKISNCSSSGTVYIAGNRYCGGLVGYNVGTIELSGSSATVGDSGDVAGGLAGVNYNGGVIKYCYASGDVTGRVVGGLVGEQKAYYNTARINDSYSMGKVTGSEGAGGLVGSTWNDYGGSTYIEYCYARGLVASQGYNGGLIGSSDGTVVRYCYYNQANTGNKIGFSVSASSMEDKKTFYMWNFDNIWAVSEEINSGTPYIDLRGKIEEYELDGYGDADDPYLIYTERDLWALVDGTYNLEAKLYYQLQNDIEITANYWTPIGANGYADFNGIFDGNGYTISGLKFANNYYDHVGFIGVNRGTIKNLNVEVVFEGTNNVGAICANNYGTVEYCSSTGLVTNNSRSDVGGLVGYNEGNIQYSYSSATVNAPSCNAGGLVGKNYNNVIQYCYSSGKVTGNNAGGLVGEQNAYYGTAKTIDSYAIGEVIGNDCTGGLIGSNWDNYGGSTYIEYCYSNGKVNGNGKGGLIGSNSGGVVTSSYYNTTLSEMTDIDRGTPLDDNTMKLQASYVGWDFDTIWSIDSATNGGYPYIWVMAPQENINVTGITLDYTEKTMQAGTNTVLIATIAPSNALNKTIIWSTSNADVANVINGKVVACAAGTAVITAKTADGNFVASCTITVTEEAVPTISVTGVTLNKTSLSLLVGESEQLIATVLPANATNKAVVWTSSNNAIATVDANGKVKAVKAGNVIITVKTVDGSKAATCKLTVTKSSVSVTGVTLDKTTHDMKIGESVKLTATVAPSNATNTKVTWTSSDPSVAEVENGVVTAKAEGTAIIVVTTADGAKTAFCTIKVTESTSGDPSVETDAYIEVSSENVCVGQSFELTVSLKENPGINTFALGIDYDSEKLQLDGVRLSDGIPGQLQYSQKAVWHNNSDTDYSGEYIVLSFTVLENAEIGDTTVSVTYQPGDISNYEEEAINFNLQSGVVSINTHSFSDYVSDNSATCTDDGTKTAVCDHGCGETDTVIDTGSATGHTFGEYVTTQKATCTTSGEKQRTCSVCDETETETIEKLGHEYSSTYTIDKEATCTEDGSKSKHCTRSGCTEKSSVTVISATGHSYTSKITNEATCTMSGVKTYICACGDSYTETIEKLGHEYSSTYTIDKEATCTEDGSKSKHCTRSGCTEKSSVTVISATGHSYTSKITNEATCTKSGVKTYTCACGDSYTETIAKLGHTYEKVVTKATLSNNGKIQNKCNVCAYVASKSTVIYRPETITLSYNETTYNGNTKKPKVTVEDVNGNVLANGTDYTVSYESGCKLPGKYTVTVTFKGKYSGTKALTLTIKPRGTSEVTATQTITTITLNWKKVTGATGYRIYKYNASTDKYDYYKSTTSTTLKLKELKSGTVYKFKVRAYTTDEGTIYGAYSSEFETATKTKTPSITEIYSKTTGKAVVKWSNVSGETGFQLYYATSKDGEFKKVKSYEANKLSGAKNELTSGKTYYFKVRAYTKTDSGTVYSSWSSVKSVKIK